LNDFLELINSINSIEDAIKILKLNADVDEDIDRALQFAILAHDEQYRKSGEPYVIHPILVASIVSTISNDKTMIIAALLHDVVEDTDFCTQDIEDNFGKDVASLVEGLTKIVEIREDELEKSGSSEKLIKSALSFRKILMASIKDLRVLVVKLCDRLHNMLTLDALPLDKQKRISEETLVVYAPIAHKLGISKIKNYLEDLSFKYIYPEDYKKIDDFLESHKQNLNLRLNHFIEKAKNILNQNGFHRDDVEVIGRVKHRYSIYLKIHRKGISIEEVLDLLAIRIIVKEPILCYKALGVLHLNYTPIVSRFKDYVALPKDNGYQTIHTTLFFDDDIVEAQIRTEDMHRLAEYGVAAHWKYKAGASNINLDWLSNLKYESESIDSFMESTKADLFTEDIVVFSPVGDSYTLPKGSVVLDYAYAVHSEVGNLATSALVNREHTSLLRILKNGDIVNIITQDTPRLHCSWIDTVKTSKAKDGIKAVCNQRLREVNRRVVYLILATIFNTTRDDIKETLKKLDLYSNIHMATNSLDRLKDKILKIAAYKKIKHVRFWELLKRGYKKPIKKDFEYFTFYTNKNIESVEFDYCCHPKLGDEIVAFHQRGRAVIHHKLCSKAYELMKQDTPMLHVEWKSKQSAKYRLIVGLQNKKGALLELLQELNKLDLNITNIELGIQSSDTAEYCKLEVETTSDNSNIIKDIISKKFKLADFISLKDAYKS
jgi:RelA/SpoT family (p)ppGpp synthetase